jgi:predicted nucleic acid-binding protein
MPCSHPISRPCNSIASLPKAVSTVARRLREKGRDAEVPDVVACRERDIPAIASFDADFDQVAWLKWIATPVDVTGEN